MVIDKIKGKYLINVTQEEALLLIQSFTNQIIRNNANVGRLESYTDKGEYCSIFVLEKNFKTTKEHQKWIADGAPIIE
jgi:hypothetical protein